MLSNRANLCSESHHVTDLNTPDSLCKSEIFAPGELQVCAERRRKLVFESHHAILPDLLVCGDYLSIKSGGRSVTLVYSTNWNLTTSKQLDFVGNHSHGLFVGVNFNRVECVIHRYSCYASFDYILNSNTALHILC